MKDIRATLFFQTYCDSSTWQIKRVLNCILWRTEPFTLNSSVDIDHLPAYIVGNGKLGYIEMSALKRTMVDTQQIYGRTSVWYALRNVSIALLPGKGSQGPEWVSFDQAEMPDKAPGLFMGLAENTDLGDIGIRCVNLCSGLVQIDPGSERQLRSTIPDLKRDSRNGDSMLAVRSPSWPVVCPKFCLFILLEEYHEGKDVLYQLLEKAIAMKSYYGEGDCQFSPLDWQTLRNWRRALKDGT